MKIFVPIKTEDDWYTSKILIASLKQFDGLGEPIVLDGRPKISKRPMFDDDAEFIKTSYFQHWNNNLRRNFSAPYLFIVPNVFFLKDSDIIPTLAATENSHSFFQCDNQYEPWIVYAATSFKDYDDTFNLNKIICDNGGGLYSFSNMYNSNIIDVDKEEWKYLKKGAVQFYKQCIERLKAKEDLNLENVKNITDEMRATIEDYRKYLRADERKAPSLFSRIKKKWSFLKDDDDGIYTMF